jgi:hypothetical protein
MHLPTIRTYYGVDFSGAKSAGRNTWIARLERASGPRKRAGASTAQAPARLRGPLALASLHRLETLCDTADRGPALAHLTELVAASDSAVWGLDFPFGLPVELFPPKSKWADQLAFLAEWGDDAYACGLECVRRALLLDDAMHIRRTTDSESRTPYVCYHYRIIYQTFFGMRDVLAPLSRVTGTAVLPFQYRRLPTAKRVVLECCPSSVLKRLCLPHQNYKQPQGGPLLRKRLRTRHQILEALAEFVTMSDRDRRVIMRNGGGDALDAVIAAVGAAAAFHAADHTAIARHARYPREGYLFF